jgi:hypothetical protein
MTTNPTHYLFLQDDCADGLHQFASYYYRIVAGFLEAEPTNSLTVAPLFPFAPRNNLILETDTNQEITRHIQARYFIDCRKFLDLSNGMVCDFDEFVTASAGRIMYDGAEIGSTIHIDPTTHSIVEDGSRGVPFIVDVSSTCIVKQMPPPWGTDRPVQLALNATNKYRFRLTPPEFAPHTAYNEFFNLCKNYLGVHWKRGENLNDAHGDTAADHAVRTDPERVGDSINYLLSVNRKANPSNPCDGVFIATDSATIEDRKKVVKIIRKENKTIPILMTPLLNEVDPLERWKYDFCDLWLGSNASALFLSPYVLQDCSIFGRLMASNARRKVNKLSVTFM